MWSSKEVIHVYTAQKNHPPAVQTFCLPSATSQRRAGLSIHVCFYTNDTHQMKRPVSNQGPLMLIASATKQNISQVLSYWINHDV